ncbi:arsenical pump-driving ATPase [Lysinibacter sp. HNR]|uniref:arsenical pump-driving ATPase n=1 Tax=Lysinibacter sp. HNR TaxID=3031408 RepID=UPI0024353FB7|nr:arsenical pump-driving ATPase [Lysinibacter sp. HNR]WGD38529.1 arsenical pump-driving ATPase [Lysinibacter sp. HNR]
MSAPLVALQDAPKFLFFTGKGGVGKTSLACAAAVALADQGKRVLLASTDPASNVGQMFEQAVGVSVTPITTVPRLSAIEIDPNQAAEAYRERILGPVRSVLPSEVVAGIEEQLSGGCTTEIAAFDEFTSLLTNPSVLADFDHIVFDTAPTGHTIRMLQLPAAWTGFIENSDGAVSSVGPLAGLAKNRRRYSGAVDALADPTQTLLVLVTRAQTSALAEAARTSDELRELGINRQHLIVNGVLPAHEAEGDVIAAAVVARESAAISAMPKNLAEIPQDDVTLRPENVMGANLLRNLLREALPVPMLPGRSDVEQVNIGSLEPLIDELASAGHGLVMTMGKGGVGKTTIAAAIAVGLAQRGHQVHLTTSDPAAHLDETIGSPSDRITVSRIDPESERERYKSHVLNTRGVNLDTQGLAVLAEDLESPCTEEIAVLQAFAGTVIEARNSFVVMDTAPTGHTLLLLDAAGAYHREAIRQLGTDDNTLSATLGILQDPITTKVLITTLAEATPILEATALQEELRRAHIEPWGWVINQSLNGLELESTLLGARAASEVPHLRVVLDTLARRVAIVPLQASEPRGTVALTELASAALTTVN